MSNASDAAVKRTMSYLFAGLFGLFAVLITLAHTIVY
jgi:hypothetical protein